MAFAARWVLLAALAAFAAGKEARPSQSCCPGLVFSKDNCNSCICSSSGLKNESRCTARPCPDAAETGKCQPLESFPFGDGLNTCLCPPGGQRADATCTKLACPEMPRTESLPTTTAHEEGYCCPGHVFDAADGCNTCRCGADGWRNQSACTLMACPPMFVPSDRCTPMILFPAGDGVNSCTCPWSGIKAEASCTDFACPQEPSRPAPEQDHCCPGLMFTAADGCNTCLCAESGLRNESSCTRLACPPSILPEGWCIPQLPYPAGDGVNSCRCPGSGKKAEAQCTNLACPDVPTLLPTPPPEPVSQEGSCCPGLTFTAVDGCNLCMCPESGLRNESACTRMACPPWMPAIGSNCTPFTAYPAGDGLNTCVCPASGEKSPVHCTHLECPLATSGPGLEDDRCCPGMSYPAPDGCNTCICPLSGRLSDPSACTLAACPPQESMQPPGHCVPLESFPKGDGINTCSCPASGLRSEARCTILPCPAQAQELLLP